MAEGTFERLMEAHASDDPRRIRAAHDEAITAIGCIACSLNVLADYVYLRAQRPNECMFASDYDVANMAYSLSDLMMCAKTALMEAERTRIAKTVKEG